MQCYAVLCVQSVSSNGWLYSRRTSQQGLVIQQTYKSATYGYKSTHISQQQWLSSRATGQQRVTEYSSIGSTEVQLMVECCEPWGCAANCGCLTVRDSSGSKAVRVVCGSNPSQSLMMGTISADDAWAPLPAGLGYSMESGPKTGGQVRQVHRGIKLDSGLVAWSCGSKRKYARDAVVDHHGRLRMRMRMRMELGLELWAVQTPKRWVLPQALPGTRHTATPLILPPTRFRIVVWKTKRLFEPPSRLSRHSRACGR